MSWDLNTNKDSDIDKGAKSRDRFESVSKFCYISLTRARTHGPGETFGLWKCSLPSSSSCHPSDELSS